MDVLLAFHAVKRQYSKSEGWLGGEHSLGNKTRGVSAASMTLEVGRVLWVVRYQIFEVVAEECFPVMCNYIVRLHCYLVYNYIKTPLSWDILSTN